MAGSLPSGRVLAYAISTKNHLFILAGSTAPAAGLEAGVPLYWDSRFILNVVCPGSPGAIATSTSTTDCVRGMLM